MTQNKRWPEKDRESQAQAWQKHAPSYRVLWKISFRGAPHSISVAQLATARGREVAISSLCTFSPSGKKTVHSMNILWLLALSLLVSKWLISFNCRVSSRKVELPCHESLTLGQKKKREEEILWPCSATDNYSQWHIPLMTVILHPWCCNIPECLLVPWNGGCGYPQGSAFKAKRVTSHMMSSGVITSPLSHSRVTAAPGWKLESFKPQALQSGGLMLGNYLVFCSDRIFSIS